MDHDAFGSPMGATRAPASPMLLQTPEADGFSFGPPAHQPRHDAGGAAHAPMDASPLVFQRTPQSPANLRFESWMSSTGKFQARTPPSASMASAARSDLDGAPDSCARDDSPAVDSVKMMRRWLGATDNGQWTPASGGSGRRGQGAAAGPGATPACTPMSGLGRNRLLHSQPLQDLGSSDADDDEDRENGGAAAAQRARGGGSKAVFTKGAAAAAARSPSLGSPGFASPAAARGAGVQQEGERTPPARGAGPAAAAPAHPASPLDKVIDLMMEPASPGLVLQPSRSAANGAAGAAPRTPSVKMPAASAPGATPPPSSARRASARKEPPTPEERVIQLMLSPNGGAGAGEAAGEGGAYGEMRGGGGSDGGADSSCGASSGGGSGSDSDSGDEIDVGELEALCAEAAAEGAGGCAVDMSPIADIIGLVLATPTPAKGTGTGARQAAGGAAARADEQDDGAGPRVLFGDD